MAAILVWTGRFFVNPDGISYLDLSDDIASGRWGDAVNAHWSPAYPALLALWLAPFPAGSQWESLAVHVLNGILFLAALGAFELFLRETGRANDQNPLDGAMKLAAYATTLWCLLVLITIRTVTPDMLMAAIGFLIAALFTRIQSGKASRATYAVFGLVLAAGALTKSLMFSVGIAIVLISIAANRKNAARVRGHLISVAVFVIVVAPQLAAVSTKTGRFTFSDSARIVYAVKVNEIQKFWTGPHVRVLSERPRALEYPTDKGNRTYPLWDDPSFWYRGAPVRFDLSDQLRATRENLARDAGIALKILVPLLFVFLLRDRRSRVRNGELAFISILVMAAYSLLYSEGRLIGFWLALLTASALTGVTPTRAGRIVANLVSIVAVISFITYIPDQIFSSHPGRGWNARNLQLDVANKARELGIRKGSRVALVGDESDIYWARLAGVKVDIQIPLPDTAAYWTMPDAARDSLNSRIASSGANAIVASWTDPPAGLTNWIRVNGTRYSILPMTGK
jgi:hypothetical protein